MLQQTFEEQMEFVKGVYPSTSFNETTIRAWWKMLKNMGDREFEMAVGAMCENEHTPRPGHIYRYAREFHTDGYVLNPKKVQDIMKVAENLQIETGTAQLMINKRFGWDWQTIPEAQVENVKSFLVENRDNWLEMVSPELHACCEKVHPGKPEEYMILSGNRSGTKEF